MSTLLIYTGGTIGMVKDEETQSLIPGGVEPIQQFLIEEKINKNIDIISTKEAIDSSNFGVDYFNELATLIEGNYHKYDAFLIVMGTDTMAYISSLLSYCIAGLAKPIVFTGGQYPLVQQKSDSKENLKNVIKGLHQKIFPEEVGVYFDEKWHRGVSVTKIDTEGKDAYFVPNFNSKPYEPKKIEFKIQKKIASRIAIIKLTPFGNEDFLKLILNSNLLNGIILEVFGSGNMPDFSEELKKKFIKKIKEGFRVVLVSQCLKGKIELGKYSASLIAQKLGFVNGSHLTTESALAKMMFLESKRLNIQEYYHFFENSIRGE